MRRKRILKSLRLGCESERGAALISALLISTLLLTAGGMLILTTSMTATNPVDVSAEMQAFYAAEAGLQRTLNVMRSNDVPAGTIPGDKSELTFRDIVLNPTLATWIPFDGPVINGKQTTLVGSSAFSVTVTDPDDLTTPKKITINPTYQPSRLHVQLTGYGPKRARKILNMIVLRSSLDGFTVPATITLRGSNTLPLPPLLTMNTGDSDVVRYSGKDAAGGASIAAFAVTIPDVLPTLAGIQRPTQIEGQPISVMGTSSPYADIPPTPEPEFLRTPDGARSFLQDLQNEAVSQNRYYTDKPPASEMGTADNPRLTFVNGDVDLGPGDNGTGLLVVTGKITMRGTTSFRGVILALGEGEVLRNGGGDGLITGGIVVAKFGPTGDFGAPIFATNGGGNSRIEYNSDAANQATATVPGFKVIGMVEK